jgi:transcriptional regulator with XRE-family HTH domain
LSQNVVYIYNVVIIINTGGEKKMTFGTFIKETRIKAGLTLRGFCRIMNIDPGNWSKIERGILPPPKSKKVLKEIATTLKLAEDSEDWHALFDLASISFIPPDLLDDLSVVEKLPVFFRTLRGEKPAQKELENLISKIRRS